MIKLALTHEFNGFLKREYSLHRRRKHSSTIFCSQYQHEGWYEQLGGDESPLADAILDRIVHDSYKINIVGLDPSKDLSMREVYGLDKHLSE
ncbi:ATP-binding protein [Acetoanaerobium sticklandii]|uniref:ATP-binding protein n=1 Tax=Acetoanaerobium sticklandii TaxID=1511 RepID=UPI003A8F9FE4